MAPKKSAKSHKAQPRSKKLGRGKKMNEVKPLAVDYFLKVDGVQGES